MQLRIQGVSCETIPRVLLGMSCNQLLNICRNFSINSEGNQWMYLVTELKDGYSEKPKIYTPIENKENITPRQSLCSHSAFSTHHDLIYLFNKYLHTDLYYVTGT